MFQHTFLSTLPVFYKVCWERCLLFSVCYGALLFREFHKTYAVLLLNPSETNPKILPARWLFCGKLCSSNCRTHNVGTSEVMLSRRPQNRWLYSLGQELHLTTPKNCRITNVTFSRYYGNISITHISLMKRLPSYLQRKFPVWILEQNMTLFT